MRLIFFAIISILLFNTCNQPGDLIPSLEKENYITENVIVIVVDGPRFSETWGDPDHKYIPFLYNRLAQEGVFNQSFYNFGRTKTVPGHTALITGVYEYLENNGRQFPTYPSYLQQWLYITRSNPNKAWVVTAKPKLAVLANCSHLDWRNNFNPSVNAYDRNDLETYNALMAILNTHKPNLIFVNFKTPDTRGHDEDWEGYLAAIKTTDSLFNEIYNYIQTDSNYAGKTTLILTNDHGRHLDEIQNGFESHGDQCSGCTHINFYATGPDFKKDVVLNKEREQIDLAPTIAHLMGFKLAATEGDVMTELFNQ